MTNKRIIAALDVSVSVLFNEPKLLKFIAWLLRGNPPQVSVLFNEPKLLKSKIGDAAASFRMRFSALQRAEIAEMTSRERYAITLSRVSVLFNEPKLLKSAQSFAAPTRARVSVLFNEPKLLKSGLSAPARRIAVSSFSALQRAEIAEIVCCDTTERHRRCFSALQRAEIAEISRRR